MHLSTCLFLFWSVAFAQDHGEEESKEMGPVAFMWPPDREWGAAVDNTAPCGSAAQPGNRTQFPMLNGQIALVMQDEAWRVQVSISHQDDPQSDDDFEAIKVPIPDLEPGHMCYPIPNPPASSGANSNATIQIKYTADFETDLNETYYACADIRYVPTREFNVQVPCFNVSSDDFEVPEEDDPTSSATAPSGADSTADSSETEPTTSNSDSSTLTGGAIAGIVIGVVVGLAIIGAFFFLWGRRKQRQKHREQEANVRAVKWSGDERSSTSGSKQEDRDIPLRDL